MLRARAESYRVVTISRPNRFHHTLVCVFRLFRRLKKNHKRLNICFMAGSFTSIRLRFTVGSAFELSRLINRAGAPFSARDAYYNGKPLIVDDMFDRVELKLRWYGSKSVIKYPRCSLLRQSTYADAEDDASQVLLLATIWILILLFGTSACILPTFYGLGLVYGGNLLDSGIVYNGQLSSSVPLLSKLNGFLLTVLGPAFGYPIASSAVGVLKGLWRNDLAALKGDCPNCGEEVFAFVRSDQSNRSAHKADCHVCECTLEFRTKVEKSVSGLSRKWVYGRIYLLSRPRRDRRSKFT